MKNRYILNYIGGCKGDFLCNFLNHGKIFLRDDIITISNKLQDTFHLDNKQNFNYRRLHDILTQSNNIIFATHWAAQITDYFIKKNNLKIINLLFDKKWERTIHIESIIKNHCYKIGRNELIVAKHNGIDLNLLKDIKYQIDFNLMENNIIINNENRWDYLLKLINYDFIAGDYEDSRADFSLDYEKIYIKKDFSLLNLLIDFDNKMLSELIEKTWLPNNLTLWDKTINLQDLGYRTYYK